MLNASKNRYFSQNNKIDVVLLIIAAFPKTLITGKIAMSNLPKNVSLASTINLLQAQHLEKLKELYDIKNILSESTGSFTTEIHSILTDLINAIDKFDMMMDKLEGAVSKEDKRENRILINLAVLRHKFEMVLKKNQVVPMNDATGKFIEGVHKAVAYEDSATVKSGLIIRVEKKGYYWRDDVLRPIEVVVAK